MFHITCQQIQGLPSENGITFGVGCFGTQVSLRPSTGHQVDRIRIILFSWRCSICQTYGKPGGASALLYTMDLLSSSGLTGLSVALKALSSLPSSITLLQMSVSVGALASIKPGESIALIYAAQHGDL